MLPTTPTGTTGIYAPSGFLQPRESNRRLSLQVLQGDAGQVGVYDRQAATDPVVAQCVEGVVLPIVQAPWELQVPHKKSKGGKKGAALVRPEIVALVEKALFHDLQPEFTAMLAEAARGMVVNGHHVGEPVARRMPDGRLTLRTVAPRPSWTIARWHFDQGELVRIDQEAYSGEGRFERISLDAKDLIVWTHAPSGGDPTGRSLLRPCYKAIEQKGLIMRLIGVWAEREALGVPIAQVPPGLGADEKKRLNEFLRGWRSHEKAYGQVPEGVLIEWKQGNPQGGRALLDVISGLDLQIRAGFLQQFQSLGTTETGSRAVGETQADPYYLGLLAIARELLGPVNKLIEQVVIWNFGEQEFYPYLEPSAIRRKDVAAALAPIIQAVQGGVLTADEAVEARVREEINLPPRVEETQAAKVEIFAYDQDNAIATIDEIRSAKGLGPHPNTEIGGLTVPEAKARYPELFAIAAEVDAGRRPGDERGQDNGQEAPRSETEALRDAAVVFAGQALRLRSSEPAAALTWRPRRMLSPGEQVVAFAEIAARLDAAPADLQRVVGNAIRSQRDTIRRWARPLGRAALAGDAEALAKADLPRSVRAAIVEAVQTYADEMRAFGRAHAAREQKLSPAQARKAAVATQEAVREEILDAPEEPAEAPLRANDPAVSLQQDLLDEVIGDADPDDIIGDFLAEHAERRVNKLRADAAIQADRIADELLRLMRMATTRAAEQAIRPGVPAPLDAVIDEVDAVLDASTEAMAVVKDAAMGLSVEAISVGREEFAATEAESITSVEYSAVMDGGTCPACAEADGKTAPSLVDAEQGGIPPTPNPWCHGTAARCRCIWVFNYD